MVKSKIAGGGDFPYHDLASAEDLCDPSSGTWTYTGPMNTSHGHYNPTVLMSDGKVLITGSAENPSCELYDPATNTWTTTGSMNVIRRSLTSCATTQWKSSLRPEVVSLVLVGGPTVQNYMTRPLVYRLQPVP